MSSTNVSASTQYNEIVDAYTALYPPGGATCPTFPLAEIENHQLYAAIASPQIAISNKRIVDFACGGGYYASKFLAWGAASVTGVDISEQMLERARRDARNREVPETKLRYVLGNATDVETKLEGGPFDIATGCWLLNYASDRETMRKMWTVIGRHVQPGGWFVGLTIQPLLSGKVAEVEMLRWALSKEGIWGKYGNGGEVLEALPNDDGYKTRIDLGLVEEGHEIASFENYYLRYELFEGSCRDSGLFDGLEWREYVIPESAKENRPMGYWNDLALWPHCRVCVARRSV